MECAIARSKTGEEDLATSAKEIPKLHTAQTDDKIEIISKDRPTLSNLQDGTNAESHSCFVATTPMLVAGSASEAAQQTLEPIEIFTDDTMSTTPTSGSIDLHVVCKDVDCEPYGGSIAKSASWVRSQVEKNEERCSPSSRSSVGNLEDAKRFQLLSPCRTHEKPAETLSEAMTFVATKETDLPENATCHDLLEADIKVPSPNTSTELDVPKLGIHISNTRSSDEETTVATLACDGNVGDTRMMKESPAKTSEKAEHHVAVIDISSPVNHRNAKEREDGSTRKPPSEVRVPKRDESLEASGHTMELWPEHLLTSPIQQLKDLKSPRGSPNTPAMTKGMFNYILGDDAESTNNLTGGAVLTKEMVDYILGKEKATTSKRGTEVPGKFDSASEITDEVEARKAKSNDSALKSCTPGKENEATYALSAGTLIDNAIESSEESPADSLRIDAGPDSEDTSYRLHEPLGTLEGDFKEKKSSKHARITSDGNLETEGCERDYNDDSEHQSSPSLLNKSIEFITLDPEPEEFVVEVRDHSRSSANLAQKAIKSSKTDNKERPASSRLAFLFLAVMMLIRVSFGTNSGRFCDAKIIISGFYQSAKASVSRKEIKDTANNVELAKSRKRPLSAWMKKIRSRPKSERQKSKIFSLFHRQGNAVKDQLE